MEDPKQASQDQRPARTRFVRIRNLLPAVSEGSFAWNSLFTSARSLVMILAQLIFTPIIVKLYDAEAYGSFGLVFSMSALLLTVFTLQFDRAILLPSNEADIRGLQAVSNALPFYFSLITLVVLLFAKTPILVLFNAQGVGNGIYLIPLLTVLGAWSQTSQKMVQVRYRYKEGFIYGSAIVIGAKLTTIAYGFFIGGQFIGIALAEFFNRIAYQVINYRVILGGEPLVRLDDLRLKKHFGVMRKYISFPQYDLPAVALNAVSNRLPVFWITRFFGLAQLGQYTLAMSLLEMPMRLFGYSLSNTFYQKAARIYERDGINALARITKRMMFSVGAVSVFPLGVIWLFSEPVFRIIFGEQWALSGSISSALAIYYFARLVVEPVVPVLRVLHAQRIYLRFQVVLFLLRLATMVGSITMDIDLVNALLVYACVNAAAYAALVMIILHRTRPARN